MLKHMESGQMDRKDTKSITTLSTLEQMSICCPQTPVIPLKTSRRGNAVALYTNVVMGGLMMIIITVVVYYKYIAYCRQLFRGLRDK